MTDDDRAQIDSNPYFLKNPFRDFLAKEGPPDKVRSFLAKLPGAGARRRKAASKDAGVMGARMRMMGGGLRMGEVQSVTQQFIACTRERIGEDEVGGLAQFV